MPRFFFDLSEEGALTRDTAGLDFPGLEAALAQAAEGAREIVAHGIMKNQDLSAHAFSIRDEDGRTVATVRFRDVLPGRLQEG
jgi:hypothetical protein